MPVLRDAFVTAVVLLASGHYTSADMVMPPGIQGSFKK